MSGLMRICKMHGSFKIGGIRMVYDYVTDEAVPEEDMPIGSKRWKASERARWQGRDEDAKP